MRKRGSKGQVKLLIEPLEQRWLLSVSLVKDINTTPAPNTGASGAAPMGSFLYLAQDDAAHGQELWRTDGTPAGTMLVKDIRPGGIGSGIGGLTTVGNTLFFTADDGSTGAELRKSDGTPGGTALVKDINPGPASAAPGSLLNINGTLYFSADDGTHGRELWKSDGTAAGTIMVTDVLPGATGSAPASFVNNNGTLFFSANDGLHGIELWKSDGTAAGTGMVRDIRAGGSGSSVRYLAALNGWVYFSANSDGTFSGQGIWKSDGTAANTVSIAAASPELWIVPSGSFLYFYDTESSGLWRSDGTPGGTFELDPNGSYLMTDVNGTLYYEASGGSLRTTNGTTITVITSGFSSIDGLINVAGTLYFGADDGSGKGRELWKSKGSALTTFMVSDINPGAASSNPLPISNLPASGHLAFFATNAPGASSLYQTDGTFSGTSVVKQIYISTLDSFPSNFTSFNGRLYFSANDGVSSSFGFGNLQVTDGTAAGTMLVKDFIPSSSGAYCSDEFVWHDKLFMRALGDGTGQEVWISDGTTAGTTLLKDINPGAGHSTPGHDETFSASGNYLYFGANDGMTGDELWRTDGTTGGTIRLTDVTRGFGNSEPSFMTDLNGALYFIAQNYSVKELWKTDGTVAGTVKVGSGGTGLCNVAGMLYLASDELYELDSAGQMVMVKDINPGVFNSSSPANLTNVGGTLFFTANDGAHGVELWKSDGTAAGTVMVEDINMTTSTASSTPTDLVAVNGVLYFVADDGVHGAELWRSDGTANGTYMVHDTVPGPDDGYAGNIAGIGGYVYFIADEANDGATGQPWRTDGTDGGTVELPVLPANDLGRTGASLFTDFKGAVYFRAIDGPHGSELWKADAPDFISQSGGTVTINATANDDSVVVTRLDSSTVSVNLNGIVETFPSAGVDAITIDGGSGDDTLDWNLGSSPLFTFIGGGGSDTLNLNTGASTIRTDLGASSPGMVLNIAAGASVTFATSQHLGALNISGNAALSAGGGKVLVVDSLSVAAGGSLDLADNDLIIRNGNLGTWNGSAYGGMTGVVAEGSIDSSSAEARRTTLGVATAGNIFGISGSQTAVWGGQMVNPGDVLVKFTYVGDANLDGKVNIDDYGRIDSNVGQSGFVFGWYSGDFNFDGKINIDDYGLIDSIIGAQGPVL